MKRFSFLFLLAALGAAGIAVPTSAQTFADASLTLERAVHAEMVSGDMDRAIALYREVAESMSASREDMAKALIALGRSYELTGSAEATTVYNRLVSEFPDQPKAFLAAHEALGRLAPSLPSGNTPGTEYDYNLLLDDATFGAGNGPWGREHDISPDGSTIVFGAETLPYRKEIYPELENELYFVESGSSVMRPVIEDAGDWIGADLSRWLPRWSPDGNQVLFRARMRAGEAGAVLARRDLSAQKTILLPDVRIEPQCGGCRNQTWLPDSNGFVTMSRSTFELYSPDGALIRQFNKDSVATRVGGVSPNGRFLAYLKQNKEAIGYTFNFNIWLLDLTSGEHIQLTRDDGFKGMPTWAPDGEAVYYTTSRQDQSQLFRKAIGTDEAPEQVTFYQNASVHHPVVLASTGELTFAMVSGSSTVMVAPADAPERAREIVAGYAPIAGPDGGTIYFWEFGPERGLWSTTLDGKGRQRVLSVQGSELPAEMASLSPDGSQFAYFLRGAEGAVLHTVPSRGGEPRRLHAAKPSYGAPAWSPDNRELAFADGPDLVVVPASGGTAETILRGQGGVLGEVTWSQDGKYIAGIAASEGFKDYAVLVVNGRTGELRQLPSVDDATYKENLAWHPESDRLSYTSMADPPGSRHETHIASADGGSVKILFDGSEAFDSYWGVWGPDGRYYFSAFSGGRPELHVYSGDEESRPFIQPGRDRGVWPLPSWSADGSIITWSEESSRTQIWSVTDRK